MFENQRTGGINLKGWRNLALDHPDEAIIILDDSSSQSALHCGHTITHFSCQAARADSLERFTDLLLQASREECTIAGIIVDHFMNFGEGVAIVDDYLDGRFSSYYPRQFVPIRSPGFLVVTGDTGLAMSGRGGRNQTTVLTHNSWSTFERDPQGSAIGCFIKKVLGEPTTEIENEKAVYETIMSKINSSYAFEMLQEERGFDKSGHYESDKAYMRQHRPEEKSK